jgi:dihydroxy-acid dehydratase
MAELDSIGLINKDVITVTGKTVGENISGRKVLDPDVIRSVKDPYSAREGWLFSEETWPRMAQ